MSLLAFFGAAPATTPGADTGVKLNLPAPDPLGVEDRSGVSSLAQPYNAPSYLDMPAHPGYASGYGVHPSVVDMQAETGGLWHGYRYWMAWTPYPHGDVKAENPCIAASNDKRTWVAPNGLVNPIYPWQGGDDYNSDTELRWEPERKRLWCFWRQSLDGEQAEKIQAAWSPDGKTWSGAIDLFSTTYVTAALSPTVVQVAPDHWRMYYIGDRGAPSGFRTASRPEGPWSEHVDIRFDTGLGDQFNTYAWHVYMRYEYGQFRMVLNTRANQAAWRLRPAVSNDGINFILGDVIQSPGRYAWERQHYRTCIVPADNGVDYDVWYSDMGSGWRIGYTQWPKKHWWDLDPRLTA